MYYEHDEGMYFPFHK